MQQRTFETLLVGTAMASAEAMADSTVIRKTSTESLLSVAVQLDNMRATITDELVRRNHVGQAVIAPEAGKPL